MKLSALLCLALLPGTMLADTITQEDQAPTQHSILIPTELYEAIKTLDVEKFKSALEQSAPLCEQVKNVLKLTLSAKKMAAHETERDIDRQIRHGNFRETFIGSSTTVALSICMAGIMITLKKSAAFPPFSDYLKEIKILTGLAGLYGIYGLIEALKIDAAIEHDKDQQKAPIKIAQEKIALILRMLEQLPQSNACA